MYVAYVCELKNVRKHPNADRLQLGDCFGNTVCVNLDYTEGQVGIYFPTDGQLSVEFAEANNLLRKKDDAGNSIGGYMEPDKRNVTAIRLRGEKSDGLFLPLTCLESFGDISELKVGDTIDIFNGHEICRKYIPRTTKRSGAVKQGNKARKKKVPVAPLFMEHADTEQLAYNLSAFHPGDQIEITLKMHGTSQRTGYLPVFKGYTSKYSMWKRLANMTLTSTFKPGSFTEKLAEKAISFCDPVYEWDYVSGTRRTVLSDYDGGHYGDNAFREEHSKQFEGKLLKGETVYYEVVGFTNTGAPIMGQCSNKKLNDKEFVKQYGDITTFSYGCEPHSAFETVPEHEESPQSDMYVYRMTMTNPDGAVVEYTPDYMRYRCEQMSVKTVPVFAKYYIPEYSQLPDDVGSLTTTDAGAYVMSDAEEFCDGPDPIGKTHIREGVVVRIVNRPKFAAYKHKNFSFKVLEGIVKANAEAPDMEEAESLVE